MTIKRSEKKDHKQLDIFFNSDPLAYYHLDWHTPMDWFEDPASLIELDDKNIKACLCTAPENEETAWVRYFAAQRNSTYADSWQELINKSIMHHRTNKVRYIAALGLNQWFETLLKASDFSTSQSVIVLSWNGNPPDVDTMHSEITIRTMNENDLVQLINVDHQAFGSLWQYSLSTLRKAYHLCEYNTVAVVDNTLVGYQISSASLQSAHLARLAVLPAFQGKGYGLDLLANMMRHFYDQGVWHITVNTQSDNGKSIKLYKKMGFSPTGESIPVYIMNL